MLCKFFFATRLITLSVKKFSRLPATWVQTTQYKTNKLHSKLHEKRKNLFTENSSGFQPLRCLYSSRILFTSDIWFSKVINFALSPWTVLSRFPFFERSSWSASSTAWVIWNPVAPPISPLLLEPDFSRSSLISSFCFS